MAIELFIASGARAGGRPSFQKSVITIGRHPSSDLQLDPNEDLLVSARHAEIRDVGGRRTLRDVGSRNGTFLNGTRLSGETELEDGDEIMLGADGPRLVVRFMSSGTRAAATPRTSAAPRSSDPAAATSRPPAAGAAAAASGPGAPPAPAPAPASLVDTAHPAQPASTDERVRVAVRKETRGLRLIALVALVLLVSGVGGAYWLGQRSSQRQLADLRGMLTDAEDDTERLAVQLEQLGDTVFAQAVRQRFDSLRMRLGGGSAGGARPRGEELTRLRNEILTARQAQEGLARMDLRAISRANDAGVAFVATELAGKPYGSTAFGVTPGGLLVTNRHNVRADDGSAPTRIAVKFANTTRYLRAHVVSVSETDSVDLALIQIDEPGTYPTVRGISARADGAEPGSPVVTIGFPHSLDLPMEGDTAKTSLHGGMVSKRLASLLQIDAYAGHGSSGSPIFDTAGNVIGVIWGGAPQSAGRIAYAVPSDRLVGFLPESARGIVR